MEKRYYPLPFSYEKALEEMVKLGDYADTEMAHIMADEILCNILLNKGYGDLVEAFEKVGKWYS